ncbi:MAG: peptidylprolyl isomerase [Phycisphaerales bacterium]|nr:peptidylprolyl isomerase [Phycisphaerales bacterium]
MSMYGRALGWLDRLAGRDQNRTDLAMMETLEPRVLLDASFPDVTDLVDPTNTVVRIKTTLGEIDFELFDNAGPGGASAAPVTVENFLSYVNSGRYLDSFFHRSVQVSSTNPDIDGDPFVIQGGGFIFTDEDGLSRVDTFDAIENEADPDRSNVERSLAMALTQSIGIDTATSQFFINLRDNNGSLGDGDIDLDAQDFTVFGRVANDRSWGVVEAIQNLETFVFADILVDTDGNPVLDAFGRTQFLDNPDANVVSFALSDVPVRSTPAPIPPEEVRSTALEEQFLVSVTSALVIKPAEAETFFTFLVGHPEGYANETSRTYVELTSNTAGSTPSFYQVVLRYETGVRDQVISSGTLQPGQRTSIAISDPDLTTEDQARRFAPFAIEIQSTRGLSASLTHSDFGATLSESFVNFTDLDARGTDAFNTWAFGGTASTLVPPDSDADGRIDNVDFRESYVVWQNLDDIDGTVTLTLYTDASTFNRISFPLEGNRRGGAELHNLFASMTQTAQAVLLESDVPIIAALSTYDVLLNSGGTATVATSAYNAIGSINGGDREGVLAGVRYSAGDGEEAYLSFLNTARSGAVVQLIFTDTDGNEATTGVVLGARDLGFFNLSLIPGGAFDPDEFLTVRYSSSVPIAGQYVAVIDNEIMSTSFQTQLSDFVILSGGLDAGDRSGTTGDVISLYNPYDDDAEVTLNFTIQFFFFDRDIFVQFGFLPMLAPGERADITARDFTDVLATLELGEDWGRYGIAIAGIALPSGGGVTPQAGQFAATLSRFGSDPFGPGNSSTISTGTFAEGTIRDLSDAIFVTPPGTTT